MARAKPSMYTPRIGALIVASRLVPCACIIDRATLVDRNLRFDLSQVSSPVVNDLLKSRPGIQVVLHSFLDGAQEKRHIVFKGSVCVGRDGRLLLEVSNLDSVKTDDLDLLLHYRGKPKGARTALKNLYSQHCRRLLEQLLPEFMDRTFSSIESDLQQAAEFRDITRLKDMRFIFQSRQQQMLQDFQAQFQANQFNLEPTAQSRPANKELHLLEQHEFEDWLDLHAISKRINTENNGLTFLLNQFLNQVFDQDVKDEINPLAPKALSVCLQYSVDHLGITREHRDTIYRAWENALSNVWPVAIRSLINDFRHGGLEALDMTELPANWSLGEQASNSAGTAIEKPREGANAQNPDQAGGVTSSAGPTAGQSLFQLMSLEAGSPEAGNSWQTSNPQLKENLRPRRQEILTRLKDDASDMEALLTDLASSDSGFSHSLNPATLEKARLVDRIFAPLDTQPELSGSSRNLLQTLRLPVFETLIETPDFLSEKDHPTRDIINDLMQLCLAERASSKKLEETIAGIIDELTTVEGSDSELLEDVSQRLRRLVQRQDQSFIRNSERLAQNLEGKERLHKTRQMAQKQLTGMLGDKQVPKVLMRLLEAGWEQLIVVTMLREGPESRQCEELFRVVTELQDWLSPDGASGELAFEKELESKVLLQFIERELKAVGDLARTRPVIDELSDILEGQLEADTSWLEIYGQADDTDAKLPAELETSRWATRARDISVGDWVEIQLDNGDTRRMRLVWGGEESLRFVFLSPKGMSEINYDFPEFIEKLAQGTVWLVKEGDIPFLDQSLFGIVEDVYRKLNFQATHDALTGCILRHDFEKQVGQRLDAAALPAKKHSAEKQDAVLLILDIDEFSVINASYGAEAGDTLLRHIAELLRSECESRFPESCLARISGNEFAVMFYSAAVEDCLDFAEFIRRNIEHEVFRHDADEYQATVSLSLLPVKDTASSPGDLLNQASSSLRAAKKRGGNQIELVRTSGKGSPANATHWVTEIDRSIRDGSLYLRAQSIVSLDPGDPEPGEGKMYELLLGLKDSSGKEISPLGYIEAAEQFKRSTKVDLWVVSEAMAWMRQNPEAMDGITTLNINLSGSSLSDDAFMLGLESTLRRSPELTHKLCFEVTETSAVANLHFAADFMRELKRMNCRFALDDFGTGLSSYAYLQKLPVDFVKIDGIFVRDMATNLTNYAMVRSINELCHFLGLQTIAEYVEDLETLDTLKEIQVNFGQGFGIAKPRRLDSLGS